MDFLHNFFISSQRVYHLPFRWDPKTRIRNALPRNYRFSGMNRPSPKTSQIYTTTYTVGREGGGGRSPGSDLFPPHSVSTAENKI